VNITELKKTGLPVSHKGYVIYQIMFLSTNLLCSYYRKERV